VRPGTASKVHLEFLNFFFEKLDFFYNRADINKDIYPCRFRPVIMRGIGNFQNFGSASRNLTRFSLLNTY